MKQRLIITGGAGVIGKELVNLVKNKFYVFVFDRKKNPFAKNKNVHYFQGDINDYDFDFFNSLQPDILVHLAASFQRSEENKKFFTVNNNDNIKLSSHIIDISTKLKTLKKYVFASSYLVYDKLNYLGSKKNISLLSEKSKILPRNMIGLSKYYHEREIEFLSRYNKNIKFIILRIFRGYGLGSVDYINRWIDNVLKKKEIKVYGEEAKFDYIYSKDSAKAILNTILYANKNKIYNIASGTQTSVKDVLKIIKSKFKKIKIKRVSAKNSLENSSANIDKAILDLKWKAKVSVPQAIDSIINFKKKDKIKSNTKINILVPSFSEKKLPWIKYIKKAISTIDSDMDLYLSNQRTNKLIKKVNKHFIKLPKINNKNKKNICDILIKNNIKIIVSNYKSIVNCYDKFSFYQKCKRLDINVPFSSININKQLKTKKKIVIKKRFGASHNALLKNQEVKNLDDIKKSFSDPLFQEQIDGEEVSVDAWVGKKNKIKGIIIRKREIIRDGEAVFTKLVNSKKLNDEFTKIIKKLNLRYHVNLQAIIQRKKIFVIECNARFGGMSTFSINLGLNSFYWSLLDVLGKTKLLNLINFFPNNLKSQTRFNSDMIDYN